MERISALTQMPSWRTERSGNQLHLVLLRARQREYVWIHFIHTPKEWSFLHPLSCNPYCSLQHYQMKESPIAFEKSVHFWMFDFKKKCLLCLFEKITVRRNRRFSRLSIISSKTLPCWGLRSLDVMNVWRGDDGLKKTPCFFTWTKSQGHRLVMIAS